MGMHRIKPLLGLFLLLNLLQISFNCDVIASHYRNRVATMIQRTKQLWEVGEEVKVGFLTLIVHAKIPTPGNFAPDAYALTNKAGDKFYQFIPHNGLHRCESLQEAMTP
jgi:hypothetical protein